METLTGVMGLILANAPTLVGFILPPFVELLNKDIKNSNQRFLISVIVCGAVALGLHWHQIAYGNPTEALASFGIVFTESQVVYKLYFGQSWLQQTIQDKIGSDQGKEDIQEPLG